MQDRRRHSIEIKVLPKNVTESCGVLGLTTCINAVIVVFCRKYSTLVNSAFKEEKN